VVSSLGFAGRRIVSNKLTGVLVGYFKVGTESNTQNLFKLFVTCPVQSYLSADSFEHECFYRTHETYFVACFTHYIVWDNYNRCTKQGLTSSRRDRILE